MSFADTAERIPSLSGEGRECIENCTRASTVCEWCADECLGDPGMEECARLCRDVADLTSLHARLMARDSRYAADLAAVCADACAACAEECAGHDADHYRVCADVLEECVESCRRMAGS